MNNSLHNFARAFNTPVKEKNLKKYFSRSVQYKESKNMQNRKNQISLPHYLPTLSTAGFSKSLMGMLKKGWKWNLTYLMTRSVMNVMDCIVVDVILLWQRPLPPLLLRALLGSCPLCAKYTAPPLFQEGRLSNEILRSQFNPISDDQKRGWHG